MNCDTIAYDTCDMKKIEWQNPDAESLGGQLAEALTTVESALAELESAQIVSKEILEYTISI